MAIVLKSTFENQKKTIIEIINKHISQANLDIEDTTIENLGIHLALNVSRELNGTFIPTSISQIRQLKKHEYYPLSKAIVSDVADTFGIKVHRSEIYYTTMYLAKMNLFDIDFNCEYDICDDVIEQVIDETVERINDELGIDLKTNEAFYKGITLHFFPAIERLQNNTQLTDNPLVDVIQAEHQKEFQCANILNEVVQKYYSKSFNNHELAYIALHFGTAF